MSQSTHHALRDERHRLLRFARHLCRSHADADDLVQDALLSLWRHQPSFPSEGHRRAWLKRVVLNSHIDRRRRDKRHREGLMRMGDDLAPVSLAGVTDELSPSLQRNVDALSNDYRNVLLLVDVAEHSYQEAADALACPIGTVMSRLHRARHQLRAQIARERPAREPGETAENAVAA